MDKKHERPVDVFTGYSNTAKLLKKQREAMESGDETSMHPVVGDNSSDEVLKRGYFKEENEE